MLSALVPPINIEAVSKHEHKLHDLFVVVGINKRRTVPQIDRKVLFCTKTIALIFGHDLDLTAHILPGHVKWIKKWIYFFHLSGIRTLTYPGGVLYGEAVEILTHGVIFRVFKSASEKQFYIFFETVIWVGRSSCPWFCSKEHFSSWVHFLVWRWNAELLQAVAFRSTPTPSLQALW